MRAVRWCMTGVCVVAAVALTACGDADEKTTTAAAGQTATSAEQERQLAFFVPILANEFGAAYKRGIEETAAKRGASVQTFDSQGDPARQLSQIQDAIVADRFDGFVIYTDDGVNVVPGVDRAVDAGIEVTAIDTVIGTERDSLVPYDGMTAMVGQTGASNGTKIGEQVVAACAEQDPCKVLLMIGSAKYSIDRDRLEAAEKVFEGHPNIEVVGTQEANYERDRGRTVMQNVLQSTPDLDVVATWGDQMALGAIPVIASAGRTDQIKLIGNGASRPGVEAIRAGTMESSYAFLPETAGRIATDLTLDAISGKDVERSVNMEEQSPPLPASGVVIDRSNVDDFKAEW
ncbi:sugar ABC transporter substrate-binding protein [Conexibacter woesei]|uniref:ABC-type sugar transport system periplasmic component-like protein n=1 Tax=Conexibacter woesei (strain DSM 14684 / CCUG 47730 / CIP 108061 / JCM 11494 / NBRC 100937 / ID131577) TaxID=469383 RepID=D3F6F6_CONWI|nr:sugar ABC transporter substrate-binding protein [Conexibacter woesei]ADB50723.1 ABC-type sugar transport system periplasmic component-like protein [Conexibacter woesei DSM 14684]